MIKQVTAAKEEDLEIRATVHTHRDDPKYLEEAYRLQVNGQIQNTCSDIGRYDELTEWMKRGWG
jgi:hypothetical protein